MVESYNKKRVLFIGVPDMAYLGINTLLNANINIVGVLGPFKHHPTYTAFKNFINSKNLNFIEYDSLDSSELHTKIRNLHSDIAVVFSFNNKFPKSFIELIPDGILNLHPSLLPFYRGGNPYSRVIMNAEKETGVSIHYVSENFDEGDIVAQIKCPVEDNETMGTLFNKTNYLGVRLMLEVLKQYEKNSTLPRHPQPVGDFVKANNLKDSECYIDYNKTAEEIERLVRALNPYLSCYTTYKGQILKVYKVRVKEAFIPENAVNGEIIKIENNEVYIKTRDKCVVPQVIQYGGYFTGDCADFINLAKPKVGDIFSNG